MNHTLMLCVAVALACAMTTAVFSEDEETPATASTSGSYKQVCYDLQAGASTPPIFVPAVSKPIHLMVAQSSTVGTEGVGEVILLRIAPSRALVWVGWDYVETTRMSGYTGEPGTHIMYADSARSVDVQTASATSIAVSNSASGLVAHGCLTFTW